MYVFLNGHQSGWYTMVICSVLALFSALVWSGLVWELSALLDRTRVSTIQ